MPTAPTQNSSMSHRITQLFAMWSLSYPLGLATDFAISTSVEMSQKQCHSLKGLISFSV